MREELAQRDGQRGKFTAVFARHGSKSGYDGRPPIVTTLFIDLKDEAGQLIADHMWFTAGVQISALDLKPGDQVAFTARVSEYYKGYVSRHYDDWPLPQKDYRLSYPTNVRKLSAPGDAPETLPLFKQAASSGS